MQNRFFPDSGAYTDVHKFAIKIVSERKDINKNIRSGMNALGVFIMVNDVLNFYKSIASGIAINQADDRGVTPLMMAAMVNDLEMFDFLIFKKAKTNVKSKFGETPYSIGIATDNYIILDYCFKRKIPMDMKLVLKNIKKYKAVKCQKVYDKFAR